MFGYSCPYCGKGMVRPQVFKNHIRKFKGVPYTIPRAVIGVCDRCGGQTFHAKEVKRWEKYRSP